MSDLAEKLDEAGLDEIDEEECWRLLASQPVGRLAVIVGQYPLVFPVNHAVVAHGVVFKSNSGTKLWATHRSNVSFEVDCLEPTTHTGWSVLVRGSAREVSTYRDPELEEIVRAAVPAPWPSGVREHLVRVIADSISGRRIRPAPPREDRDSGH